mgnify:CR=1 FL=1
MTATANDKPQTCAQIIRARRANAETVADAVSLAARTAVLLLFAYLFMDKFLFRGGLGEICFGKMRRRMAKGLRSIAGWFDPTKEEPKKGRRRTKGKTEKKEVKMNRLIVPRGGEYRVELADGTLVYLNAESELQYPVTFIGESREVTLRGEAYFKVTKNNEKPFIVKSDGLSVQVWGTEFNLNTLNQEGYYAATLVEGSVEVKVPGRHSVFLEPSQQARVDCTTSDITCLKVNTLPYTAWKDGKFVFNHEDMQHITMRLEKWYDVEFTYSEETLKNLKVFGVISRYEDITKVLKLLSATRLVSFRYVNHKIMVVPYQRF